LLWLASHDRRGGDIDLLERVRGDGALIFRGAQGAGRQRTGGEGTEK